MATSSEIAEGIGNGLLAESLRDLTARTTLISMLYRSPHDASQSCDDPMQIVAALEMGDFDAAACLMSAHIGNVGAGLRPAPAQDALSHLREALPPVSKGAMPIAENPESLALAPIAAHAPQSRGSCRPPGHPR